MKWSLTVLMLGMTAACADGSQGSSTAASSGGAATGGSAGTSTGAIAMGIGSCSQTINSQTFASCSVFNPCGCPLACIADPAFGSPVCELPCTDPCPTRVPLPGMSAASLPTSDACVDGYCRLDACAFDPNGAMAPGGYDGLCTVVASNDGTCFPVGALLADGGVTQWGVCLLGNPEGVCGPSSNPSCPAGAFCVAGGCRPACDPTVAGSCTDGASCQNFPAAVNPHAGYCGPPCSLNGQACGEVCCDPFSSCTGHGTGTGGSGSVCNPGG